MRAVSHWKFPVGDAIHFMLKSILISAKIKKIDMFVSDGLLKSFCMFLRENFMGSWSRVAQDEAFSEKLTSLSGLVFLFGWNERKKIFFLLFCPKRNTNQPREVNFSKKASFWVTLSWRSYLCMPTADHLLALHRSFP